MLACGLPPRSRRRGPPCSCSRSAGSPPSRTISNVGLVIAAFAGAAGCLVARLPRGHAPPHLDLPRVRVDLVGPRPGDLDVVRGPRAGRCRSRRTRTSATWGCRRSRRSALLLLPSATADPGRAHPNGDRRDHDRRGRAPLQLGPRARQVYAAGGDGILTTAFSLAYPLGDVVAGHDRAVRAAPRPRAPSHQIFPMWMIVLGLVRVRGRRLRLRLPRRRRAQYGSGSVIDIGWFVCFVAIVLAACTRRRSSRPTRSSPRTPRTLGLLLPYVAVGLALVDRARSRSSARARRTSSSPGAACSSSRRWWSVRS